MFKSVITRPAVLAIAGLGLVLVSAPKAPRLYWNASSSVPIGLYRLGGLTYQAGDLLVSDLPDRVSHLADERGYLPLGVPLIKPIAAKSGQTICRTDNQIVIDGRTLATAKASDRLGRNLPQWAGCHQLGQDELFLLNPLEADSFDGRYFGPTPKALTRGRAIPVFVLPLF